ncbi:transposase [Sphingomonas melonis]|uniref:transposase n=1 Tax=Sphingomonas melonis TaxID=152682 RepID=UPI0015C9CC99
MPQYATALDKIANCQKLVLVTLASDEGLHMLSLRLVPAESWMSDAARRDKASVPAPVREYRTGPDAIEEIDRVVTAGVRFCCVLANTGYGLSVPSIRQRLKSRPPPGRERLLSLQESSPRGHSLRQTRDQLPTSRSHCNRARLPALIEAPL